MNSRRTVMTALTVFVVLFSVYGASGSDAADSNVFEKYYYSQLSVDERMIYDLLEEKGAEYLNGDDSYLVTVDDIHYFKVHVDGLSFSCKAADLTEAKQYLSGKLGALANQAFYADKLDNPLACWTWSNDHAIVFVEFQDSDIVSVAGGYYALSGADILIQVYDAYYGADAGGLRVKYNEVKDAIGAIELKGEKPSEVVKSINSLLVSSDYEYDPNFDKEDFNPYNSSVYGAFVHKVDGKFDVICGGFASAFKALCDREHIPALMIFGTAAQEKSNGLHAWNMVVLNGYVYGADVTFDIRDRNAAYLGVGSLTVIGSSTFSQVHQAFTFYGDDAITADFRVPTMANEAFEWPNESDNSIIALLSENVSWILIGVICVLLAFVLIRMGKQGE